MQFYRIVSTKIVQIAEVIEYLPDIPVPGSGKKAFILY